MVLLRLIIGALALVGLYFLVRRLITPPQFIKCQRCDGKGFWYTARDRETCDWCRGSGKMPRELS